MVNALLEKQADRWASFPYLFIQEIRFAQFAPLSNAAPQVRRSAPKCGDQVFRR